MKKETILFCLFVFVFQFTVFGQYKSCSGNLVNCPCLKLTMNKKDGSITAKFTSPSTTKVKEWRLTATGGRILPTSTSKKTMTFKKYLGRNKKYKKFYNGQKVSVHVIYMTPGAKGKGYSTNHCVNRMTISYLPPGPFNPVPNPIFGPKKKN